MANIWEQPILQLAKPQKDYYTVLTGVKSFQSKLYLNNISEISFRVYEYENNERNELYDALEETQLIEAIDYEVEWFQIAKVDEKKDDVPVAYKDITCNSLEDELISKTVYNLNGVYKLYNIEDTTKSIMHIITNDISWNIGYISPSLASLYRTLSIDSGRIYSLLTSDLSKSFGCIFKFNREYKTISAYTLDEIGEETDIVISEQNLLKSWEKSSDKDKIVTKMRVLGGTNTSGMQFDIRKVNFGGSDIINYSYFKPRMSIALQTALTNWETAIETNTASYNTNIAILKTYDADLNILNNAMTEIESQISTQEKIINISLQVETHKGLPPISTDADYTGYINAINQLATLNTQKANKQAEIDAKNAQIVTVNSTLDNISSNVDKSKFFTSALLDELDCFTYVGDDYVDETFLCNNETTSEQEIEMAVELKSNAEKELFIACKPQPEFKATLNNLWSLYDEKDCVISYDTWRSKFRLGNIVTIILNDNSWTTVRIIGIELDYDNPSDAIITFSSRTRLDNSTFNLGEIQAQASRVYSAVSMNKYSWNQAASQTSDNEEFRNDVLTATNNKMLSDPFGKVEFGEFGIKCRDWVESEKAYGLNGMWLNPYRMIFTEDGFKTAGSAFGLLSFPDGTQHMCVNAEYVMGKVLMGQYTYITNSSGNYTINNNGFTATATLNSNTYSAGINPSTPAEIINAKINGTKVFGIDTVSNSLYMKGKIEADSGTLGNLTVTGTLTNGTISGAHIISQGILQETGDTIKTEINGGKLTTFMMYARPFDINKGDFADDSFGYTLLGSSALIIKKNATTTGFMADYDGNVTCSKINNADPVTSSNYSTWCTPWGHLQSSSTVQLEINNGWASFYMGSLLATPSWCLATFEPKSSSDFRLKKNIVDLNLPNNMFMELKPKEFIYKDNVDPYHPNKVFGLLAQEVESLFQKYSLDPFSYNLIEKTSVNSFTDEGLYVNDEVHRINYTNLITWMIKIIQNQNSELTDLKNRIVQLEAK